MIKTLRKKFIFTSMVAVTILLIVLIGTTNILHISLNNSMSDRMLERISDLSYEFPPKPPAIDKTKPENFLSFPQISKDNEMAARFFIVTLDNNGNILRAHTDRISAVSNDEAEKMAKEVYKKTKPKVI